MDYAYLAINNKIASTEYDAIIKSLKDTIKIPVIAFILSNTITVWIVDKQPHRKYFYIFLNSIFAMFFLNLASVQIIDSTTKQQPQTQ